MKRDQFGRSLRKVVVGYLSSERIISLYNLFCEHELETIQQFLNKFADAENLVLPIPKPPKNYRFPQPTQEQIKKHQAWKKEVAKKAAKNLAKKPKKGINQQSVSGKKVKKKEAKAMRKYWNSRQDYRGWCQCEETGEWLRGYAAYYVHHIWTKGSAPKARYDNKNFVILSALAHNQAHDDEKKLSIYPALIKRRQQLKIKYARKILDQTKSASQ